MIENGAKKLTSLLINKNIIVVDDYEVYSYGFQLMIATLLKGTGLILISLLLDIFNEFMVFIIFFSILRVYAGGYHSKSYLECFITTATSIFVLIGLSKVVYNLMNIPLIALILIISCGLVFKYAPIESPNKPLNKNQKNQFRKNSIRIVIIESIIILMASSINAGLLIYSIIATFAIALASLTLIPYPKIITNNYRFFVLHKK